MLVTFFLSKNPIRILLIKEIKWDRDPFKEQRVNDLIILSEIVTLNK